MKKLEQIKVLLNIATWISIVLVFGMALFQFSLTLGAPLGAFVLGGKHRVLPVKMRLVSVFFFLFFTIMGLSFLQRANKITAIFNVTIVNVLLVIYTLFLAYAIVGNGFLTKSKKEKYLMTPLSIVGFISSVYFLFNN